MANIMSNQSMLLIYNPCSGKNIKRKPLEKIVAAFEEHGFTVTSFITKCVGDATEIVFCNAKNFDIIVCCGGDGTFNETINGILRLEKRIPLGYIPNGTTNDMAKTFGIPLNLNKAVKLIADGFYNWCDIGLIGNRYFSCGCSFGFGAKASLTTPQKVKNIIGEQAYLISGIKNASAESIAFDIMYDEGKISGDFIFGAIVNSTSVGGIFKLNKNVVKLNDGKFEVILVSKVDSIIKVPKMIMKLQHQEYDGTQVIFLETRQIKFTSKKPVQWLVDGECGGELTQAVINNLTKAIKIYSPASDMFINTQ